MKNKSIFKILSMFWISSLIFTACMSDVDLSDVSDKIMIDESLVVPVGEASVNVRELLDKLDLTNLVTTDPTEIYFESIDSTEYKFRDVNLLANSVPFTKTLNLNPGAPVVYPANTAIPTVTQSAVFDLGLNSTPSTERVDSVKVKNATFSAKVTCNIVGVNANDITVSLIFPPKKFRKSNGSGTITLTPTAFNVDNDIVLSNFAIITDGNASGLPLDIKLDIRKLGVPITLNSTSQISVQLKFKTLNFDVAFGAFQPSLIASETQTIPLDVASYLPDALLKFANPKATIDVTSNIGTYIRFKVDYIKAYVKADPTKEVKASFNGSDSYTYNLAKPANPGDSVTTQLVFDKDNGQTNKLFESAYKPDMLEYKFSTLLNTDALNNSPTLPLFFPSYGKIKAKIKVQIPLHLNAGSNIEYKDTIDIEGGTIGSKLDNTTFENTALVLKVKNGLPVKANFAVFFIDSIGRKIETTLDDTSYTINAPSVDASGVVVVSSIASQIIKINMNKTEFNDLRKAQKVGYVVKVEGKDATSAIHFTKNDSFKLNLGVFVKGNTVQSLGN